MRDLKNLLLERGSVKAKHNAMKGSFRPISLMQSRSLNGCFISCRALSSRAPPRVLAHAQSSGSLGKAELEVKSACLCQLRGGGLAAVPIAPKCGTSPCSKEGFDYGRILTKISNIILEGTSEDNT